METTGNTVTETVPELELVTQRRWLRRRSPVEMAQRAHGATTLSYEGATVPCPLRLSSAVRSWS